MARSASAAEPATLPCPTCGGLMSWKRNRITGSRFQGCDKWPVCNGTRTVDGVDSRIALHVQTRLHRFLKAAVLHSEDECLTFSSEDLEVVDHYDLHIDEVTEDKSFVVTVQRKK